jgi:transcriptional regulator with XRE-family HTH domain
VRNQGSNCSVRFVHESDIGELSGRIGAAIRAHRLAQGLSIAEMARSCGLSRTILARIEAGAGNPSVETLWRVSRALNVPLGALLAEDSAPRIRHIPARDGEPLHADSGMRAWTVHADGREHRCELYDLELPAGAEQSTGAHLPGTEEVLVCVSGRARIGPVGEEVEIGPGESVWFVADRDHRYVALEDTRLLNLMLYGVGGA